jgi:hypothetical protein
MVSLTSARLLELGVVMIGSTEPPPVRGWRSAEAPRQRKSLAVEYFLN